MTATMTAVLNNPSTLDVEDLDDRTLGVWAIRYDTTHADSVADGRVCATVPSEATDEEIGSALRAAYDTQP